MKRRTRVNGVLFPLVAIGAIAPITRALAADNLAVIQLDAQQTLLRADGRSTTVISAQVYVENGKIAPDGTRVRFTTTAGRLDSVVATTQNGVARVTLVSADQPGNATILAVLETPGRGLPARITVTFSMDAEVTDNRNTNIRINGAQYIGYAAGRGIIQANGKNSGASLTFRNFRISADALQFDVQRNTILAIGNVRLKSGVHTNEYDHVKVSILDGTGIAERITDGHISAFDLGGGRFEATPFPLGKNPPPSQTWTLTDISDSGITVVSRSVIIEPGKRLQFRRATFYVDGSKAFSTPLHVMNLGQDSIFPEQVVGYGQEGLMVDFPFYYQADPSGIGTVNFRRAARVSSSAYSVRPGWSMDLTQNYNGSREQNGTLELNGLTRPDWGMRLRHAQRLSPNTTGNIFIDFPNHSSLFFNTQAARTFKSFTLNSVVSGSRSPGYHDPVSGQSTSATGYINPQLYAETFNRPVRLFPLIRYAVNAGVSQQNLYGQTAFAGQAKPPSVVRSESINTRFFTPNIPVARATSVRQSFSLGRAWYQGQGQSSSIEPGITIQGTTVLSRGLGRLGTADLSYDYTQRPVPSGFNSPTANGKHRLSISSFLGKGPWDLSVTGSHGLDTPQSSVFGTLQVRMGGPWRGRVTGSLSSFSGFTYQEVEYSLIRQIAGRDFGLYYSTTSRRFQVDLTGAKF